MIWVAWKQHRAGVITAVGVLVAFAALLLTGRLGVAAALAEQGEEGCMSEPDGCSFDVAAGVLDSHGMLLTPLPLGLYMLPVLVGLFAGAPVFARELSQGSHMFSLTQSVSRKRWWAVKLGVTLVPIAVAFALFGMYSHWVFSPVLDLIGSPLYPGNFEVHGTVMAGYMVFAFAAASTLGLVTRNNVVPMVVTIGVYIVVAFTVVLFVRPVLLPAQTGTLEADAGGEARTVENAWQVGETYVGEDGREYDHLDELCKKSTNCEEGAVADVSISYHPMSQFWVFQALETGIYLLLAAAALYAGARRLRALP